GVGSRAVRPGVSVSHEIAGAVPRGWSCIRATPDVLGPPGTYARAEWDHVASSASREHDHGARGRAAGPRRPWGSHLVTVRHDRRPPSRTLRALPMRTAPRPARSRSRRAPP